jgi:N-acyl homoserine lactone hydrolase
MTASRMFVLQYGAERVSKSLSLRGGPPDLTWEPLMGVAVDTSAGWVLFDTGMAREAHDSEPEHAIYRDGAQALGIDVEQPTRALYPAPPDPHGWHWGLPGDPMATALAGIGLTVEDLTLAVVSHFHLDHTGGIPLLARAGGPGGSPACRAGVRRHGSGALRGGLPQPGLERPGDPVGAARR